MKTEDFIYTCPMIVNDLMNSSYAVQRWDAEQREAYYTRVVAIAYTLGQNHYNKNIFTRIVQKIFKTI